MTDLESEVHYKVSPSQLTTWNECERKWGFQYILKIRGPAPPSAQIGTETHAKLEAWHNTGVHWSYEPTPLDPKGITGYIADAALEHLPPPGTGKTEAAFSLGVNYDPGNPGRPLMFHGYRDLTVPPSPWGPLTYVDYKTTSDFRYAKTKEDLLTDPQGVIYAVATMHEYEAPEMNLMWLYLHKTRYTAMPVKQTVTRVGARKEFNKLVTLARKVERVHHAGVDPLTLTPSPDMCRAYGGCPFQSRCNLGPDQLRRSFFAGPEVNTDMSSVIEQIKARQAQISNAFTETLTSPVTPISAPALPPIQTIVSPAATSPVIHTSPAGQVTTVKYDETNAPPRKADPINCPEKPVVSVPATVTPEQVVAAVEKGFAPVTGQGTFPDQQPAKKARTPSAEVHAKKVAEAKELLMKEGLVILESETFKTLLESPDSPGPSVEAEKTLYVNCRPSWDVVSATVLYVEANKQLGALKGVQDYRQIAYEGAGLFSTLVAELAKGGLDTVPELFIDTNTPEGAVCLSKLEVLFGKVVRA